MIIKLASDHIIKESPFCGQITEILTGAEYSPNVAVATDIRPTRAHFHRGFDEIYLVLNGELQLMLYEPSRGVRTQQRLSIHELCVISRGVHHQVTETSAGTRLCIICIPRFDPSDEQESDQLLTLHQRPAPNNAAILQSPQPAQTAGLRELADYLAPDGSQIRLLPTTTQGGLCHCTLPGAWRLFTRCTSFS